MDRMKQKDNWFEYNIFLFKNSCLTNTKESSLPYYLPIARKKTEVFISSPKTLS